MSPLQSRPYNSGATGADTLFASVPIVSLPANKPVGRMGASMLSALRLPELIVRTPGEYARVVQALVPPPLSCYVSAMRCPVLKQAAPRLGPGGEKWGIAADTEQAAHESGVGKLRCFSGTFRGRTQQCLKCRTLRV
eukprot:59998-Rhodomonas_salina.2